MFSRRKVASIYMCNETAFNEGVAIFALPQYGWILMNCYYCHRGKGGVESKVNLKLFEVAGIKNTPACVQ